MYLFIYLEVFSPRENIWNKISMRILLEKKKHKLRKTEEEKKKEFMHNIYW